MGSQLLLLLLLVLPAFLQVHCDDVVQWEEGLHGRLQELVEPVSHADPVWRHGSGGLQWRREGGRRGGGFLRKNRFAGHGGSGL